MWYGTACISLVDPINDLLFGYTHVGKAKFELYITDVDKQPFAYVIPSFPVMTVDLVKVKYEENEVGYHGVVNYATHSHLTVGKYTCTSHCNVTIEEVDYTVLWELHHDKPDEKLSSCSPPIVIDVLPEEVDSDREIDADVPEIEGQHCLPFKVLGTCYSESRQKALDRAYDCMNEYNRPVFVKLEAEPENRYDANAIAVFIMTTDDYDKVGYIASELTKYLHAPLKANALDVEAKEIRFRTTYMLTGYYLTINIAKKGKWPDAVIRASRKVH